MFVKLYVEWCGMFVGNGMLLLVSMIVIFEVFNKG